MRFTIITIFILSICFGAAAAAQDEGIYTNDYALSFFPDYPPYIGETMTLRLRAFLPAQKVTLYSDRELEIPMVFRNGFWWGKFDIPEDYQEGGHFFTVWIRYTEFNPKGFTPRWVKSKVWYKAFKKPETQALASDEAAPYVPYPGADELEEIPLPVTGEAMEMTFASPEASALMIKGSQSITFKTRSLEGSKEGYVAGTQQTREESLRVNVSGKAADTDIDATLYRTSATGVNYIGENEEKISILLRRGSTEAYLGDFTADYTETEFTRLDKVLSGGNVKGDYGGWGFNALYSSPKGESKFIRIYGDGTQGPYDLGFSPVVIDSERVTVNGVQQYRGDDYTIDYQAGSVTFLKMVVDPRSVIQINYDYRQTVYQHATYGLRGFTRPNSNLKIGVTYLDDSDSKSQAEEIRGSISGEAVDPKSHYVVGTDINYVSENISAGGEIAYSEKNLDILSPSSTKESGKAGKFNITTAYGPFGLTGGYKRVDPQFSPVADPDPRQDVTEYTGGLSFRPNSLFGSQGNYTYQKYLQSGVVYENLYKSARAQLTPENLPSLEYNFLETDESNDPVTGSSIRRVITKNSVETIHQSGFLSTSLKGTLEKWLRRSPSEEVTDYKKINLGLASVGLEKISFTSNAELEERSEPTGLTPYKRTYNLNLSANPSSDYFLSSSFQIIDDSELGQTNVTDLSYRAEPSEHFKTEGKYTITSLLDEFPATKEAVSKQSGSFSFDLRPYKYLRLRYLHKPNFTQIQRTGTLSYDNLLRQTEINLVPVQQVMLGAIYKLGSGYSVFSGDYPDYTVRDKIEESDSTLYTLKMAPFQMLSTEFNFLTDNSRTDTLASTEEPYAYLRSRSRKNVIDSIVKTSLSEKFSIDSRYTFQKNDQGSGESLSNITDTKTHTGSLKGIWNLSEEWTFSISGAFSRTTDYILSTVIYTVSPGAGFIYRMGDRLRMDFDYVYSKSYSGAETEVNDLSLKSRYSVSEFVDFTVQIEHEIGRAPDYKLTDITGNIEINL